MSIFIATWMICILFIQLSVCEVTINDINTLRNEFRSKYDQSGTPNRPLLAAAVRLIFHDCAGPNNEDANIISSCNGCIDIDLDDNAGLFEHAVIPLNDTYSNWSNKMSVADFWAAAATIAIECAQELDTKIANIDDTLPNIAYYFGREDCIDDINLKGFPSAFSGWIDTFDWFHSNLDFNERDTITILGAHTLGKTHIDRSGFDTLAWVKDQEKLNNQYYKDIIDQENTWTQSQNNNGFYSWSRAVRDYGLLIMLNSDMCIWYDIDKSIQDNNNGQINCTIHTCPHNTIAGDITYEYATYNQLWLDNFAKTFDKLVQTGYQSNELVRLCTNNNCVTQSPTAMHMPTLNKPTISPSSVPTVSPINYHSATIQPTTKQIHKQNTTNTSEPTKTPTTTPVEPTIKYHNIQYQNAKFYESNANWTQFIYMIGDNDLDKYGVMDLNELFASNINFVVYMDRSGESKTIMHNVWDCENNEEIDGYFDGAKVFQKVGNRWCVIIDFKSDMNSLSVNNIVDFVSLFEHFESSKHYVLEFWDHGRAWINFGLDKHQGTSNTLAIYNVETLINAIREGLDRINMEYIDILAMDACNEADGSPLYYISLNNIALYYLASERIEPLFGWDYTKFNGNAKNGIDYAIVIINAYIEQHQKYKDKSFTLTLFDTHQFSKFINKFDELIQEILLIIGRRDYGMIMSVFRAYQTNIIVNQGLTISDIGLFYKNLINDERFFRKCNNNIKILVNDSYEYYENSIKEFKAINGGQNEELTGASIFMSFKTNQILKFKQYNSGSMINHWASLLFAMNNVSGLFSKLTNDTCNMQLPTTSKFWISEVITKHNKLIHLTAAISQLVRWAKITISINDNDLIDDGSKIVVAELMTEIKDIGNSAELSSYWNGIIVRFLDYNNDFFYSTGSYSCFIYSISESNYLCIIQFSVNIYYDESVHNGYLQFEMSSDMDIHNINVTLIQNDIDGEVLRSENNVTIRFLTKDQNNVETELLLPIIKWPNVLYEVINVSNKELTINVIAQSVFDEVMYSDNNNHNNFINKLFSLLVIILISVVCVLIVIIIIFYTFKRWKKQKILLKTTDPEQESESTSSSTDNTIVFPNEDDNNNYININNQNIELHAIYDQDDENISDFSGWIRVDHSTLDIDEEIEQNQNV